MVDDAALLREYAATGSEAAFAELVQRHLDVVYSTALRTLQGNESLAKDVTQQVFLDLARKASALSNRPVLTGWLHAAAVLAGAKAARSESRRRAREQEAHAMHEVDNQPPGGADWEDLRSILDTTLLELKTPDREALLLRFFERRSFAAVGEKLGLTENAARMRVERALDKLHRLLERRGITSTAAALAAVLAQQTVAAPAGLALSITTASATAAVAGGGFTTSTLMLMSNAKAIILGTIIVAGVSTPIFLQYQANVRLRAENERLRSQVAPGSRGQAGEKLLGDEPEKARVRDEGRELLRLRSEVTSLRREAAASRSNAALLAEQALSGAQTQSQAITDADVTEFRQRPLVEQAKLLGAARGQLQGGGKPTPEWARTRLLAEKVRPELEQLESRPSDFADFQSAFIQAAVGLQKEEQMAQIRSIIQATYEKALAEHLDSPSRPQEGAEEWATRRDALDREATRQVQQFLSPDQRARFDSLFLGVMGVDLGLGDGAWNRFVDENGAIFFPSEEHRALNGH